MTQSTATKPHPPNTPVHWVLTDKARSHLPARPWTYRHALRVVGRVLGHHPELGMPAVATSYLDAPHHVAELLLLDGHQTAAGVLAWARVMDDVTCIQLVPYKTTLHIRLVGRLWGPLVQVTACTDLDPGGMVRHEVTVAELESLAESRVDETTLAGVS